MLNVIYTGRFKKDYKKCIKRGLDIVNILALPATLPVKNQDHDLKGNYKGRRECHITPDWLLIYTLAEGFLVTTATATPPKICLAEERIFRGVSPDIMQTIVLHCLHQLGNGAKTHKIC